MIPINDYRQFIAELVAAAAQQCCEPQPHIRLAVTESQLINMLKDMPGIVVAGNIPGTELQRNGYWKSSGECLLAVLEKMPADMQGTECEYQEYERMQHLMVAIVRLLTGEDFQQFCDRGEIDPSRPLQVEWEYNQYGGFNGLSVSWRINWKEV
jgi:hypothetical protein